MTKTDLDSTIQTAQQIAPFRAAERNLYRRPQRGGIKSRLRTLRRSAALLVGILTIAALPSSASAVRRNPGPGASRRQATPKAHESTESLLNSADNQAKAGRAAEAMRLLLTATKAAPRDPRPLRRLAEIYRRAGYMDREIETTAALLAVSPSDADFAFRLTDLYLSLAWYPQARRYLILAARSAPNDRRVFLTLATQAYMRFQPGPMEKAAAEGLRRWPGDSALAVLLSEADRLQGKFSEAESLLRRAVDTAPDSARKTACTVGLARLYLEEKWIPSRVKDAESAARAALRMRPGDTDAEYYLGIALERQGRWKEAIPLYEATAKKDPKFESVAFRLGHLYQRLPDSKKHAEGARFLAIHKQRVADEERFRSAREGVTTHPESAASHRKMGAEYLRGARAAEAISELREALRLSPGDKETRKLLGRALRLAGRKTEAQTFER